VQIGFTLSYIALWIVVIFLALVAIEILRRITEIRSSLLEGGYVGEQLPLGSAAAAFASTDLRSGQAIASESLLGSTHLLIFLSPACHACRALADALRFGNADLPPVVAVCTTDAGKSGVLLERLPAAVPLLADPDRRIQKRYHVAAPPMVVVIDGEWRVRGVGHPNNLRELKLLVNRALSYSDPATTATPAAAHLQA
jgi:hypothetical protein